MAARNAQTFFGMVVPPTGTAYSARAPHFPKNANSNDSELEAGLRCQFQTVVDAMIESPRRIIPVLFSDVQKQKKLVAKFSVSGEELVTALTIGQLHPELSPSHAGQHKLRDTACLCVSGQWDATPLPRPASDT